MGNFYAKEGVFRAVMYDKCQKIWVLGDKYLESLNYYELFLPEYTIFLCRYNSFSSKSFHKNHKKVEHFVLFLDIRMTNFVENIQLKNQ